MKRLLLLFGFGLMLSSCMNTSMEGTFVKVKENGRGAVSNAFNKGFVDKLTIGETMCRFEYFGTVYSGKYTIEDNRLYIEAGGELATLSLEIVDNNTLEGEGWCSGTFKKKN
jgi:hypothetical protein